MRAARIDAGLAAMLEPAALEVAQVDARITNQTAAAISGAISAKRIADALERLADMHGVDK